MKYRKLEQKNKTLKGEIFDLKTEMQAMQDNEQAKQHNKRD